MTGDDLLALLPDEIASEIRLGGGGTGLSIRVAYSAGGVPTASVVRTPCVFGTRPAAPGEVRSLAEETVVDDVLELAILADPHGRSIPPSLLNGSIRDLEARDAVLTLSVRSVALALVEVAAEEIGVSMVDADDGPRRRA